MTRRKLTTLDKLKIAVEQARCPLCNEKLGDLAGLQWDHEQALCRGGTDTLDNIRAVHIDCHKVKTFGTGATTLGSDIHERAKTDRLTKDEEAFQRRLLAKRPGQPRSKSPKWKSRPFPKRVRPETRSI